MCWYFGIGFIDFMLKGKSLTDFTNPFYQIISKKKEQNNNNNNNNNNSDIILYYFKND